MRENAIVRFNDHQQVDGVQEFSVEVAIPGRFSSTVTGASRDELYPKIEDTFKKIFILLGIPEQVDRQKIVPQFMDSAGVAIPVSPFAAQAEAKFEAEVYRNGIKVE